MVKSCGNFGKERQSVSACERKIECEKGFRNHISERCADIRIEGEKLCVKKIKIV